MLECDYQIALSYIDENNLEKAVECLEALGDYADAEELKQVCMYDYLQANLSNYYFDSGYMRQWLEQLVNAGYPGAEALSDRLNGVGCYFALQYGNRVLTDGEKLEAPDLGEHAYITPWSPWTRRDPFWCWPAIPCPTAWRAGPC